MYKLKELPYAYDAIEPFISGTTVNIHYNKHHKRYLDKLNSLLDQVNYKYDKPIEDIIVNIGDFPINIRGDILFNAGGVVNHDLYWRSISPVSKMPTGVLLTKIKDTYGDFDNFKQEFIKVTKRLVGSGYTFLVMDKNENLNIINTSNQESPYSYGFIPLLTIDLWEHAYYLDYQNKKDDYINSFFSIINFEYAEQIYEKNL